jgi:acyl-CoA synthetase (AMP-forming)/AMP-acid ligase II
VMVVVKKPGVEVTAAELIAFYDGKIPKWQTPDDVVFVDEIPHTATGKIYKLKLRETFKDHKLPTL